MKSDLKTPVLLRAFSNEAKEIVASLKQVQARKQSPLKINSENLDHFASDNTSKPFITLPRIKF